MSDIPEGDGAATPRLDPRARYVRSLQYGTLAALLLLIGAFTAPVSADAEAERLSAEIGPVELVPMINTVEPLAPPPPPPPAPPPPIEVPDDIVVDDEIEAVEFDSDVLLPVHGPPPSERELSVPEPVIPDGPRIDPPAAPIVEPEDDPNRVWEFVQQEPVLIGGLDGLAERLVYPDLARRINAEGTVVVQFVVDERGTVTDAVVVRAPHETLADEALRVIRESRFQPGQQRGRPVKARYTLPVRFTLR